MSTLDDADWDHLLRSSLTSVLRRAEPSPLVWCRIRDRLEQRQPAWSARGVLGGWLSRLTEGARWMGDCIFSVPGWHDRLAERRAELLLQITEYPGATRILMAVG
jgi:hypothetical protein